MVNHGVDGFKILSSARRVLSTLLIAYTVQGATALNGVNYFAFKSVNHYRIDARNLWC